MSKIKGKNCHNENKKQVTDSDDDELPLANILKVEKVVNNRRKLKKKSTFKSNRERAIAIKKECDGRDPLGLSDGESHMNAELDIILNPFHIKQEAALDVGEIKHDYENDEDFQFFMTLVPLMDRLSPERKSKIRKDLINVVVRQCNDAIEQNEYDSAS